MKKIFITFLCIGLLLNHLICDVAFAQEITGQVVDKEILNDQVVDEEILKFIETIGIINYSVDSPDKYVTREMFALYVARVLKIDEYGSSDKRYFYDMENSGFATTAVNELVDRKIITVGENRKFRPSDYITSSEVSKMLVSMLGYDSHAEAEGGFPLGYFTVANQFDIIDDELFGNSKFTVAQVSEMLYNAVQVRLPEKKMINGSGDVVYSEPSKDSNNTILSVYHGIYFVEGTVTGIYGGSMNLNGGFADKNELLLDDVVMNVPQNINTNDLLSSYVKVFHYNREDGDKTPEIIYIKSNEGKEADLIIDISNFIDITNSEIEYYKSDKDVKGTKTRLKSPVLLYNNYRLTENEAEVINNLNKGYIQVKDSNGDGNYDAVNFRDYKNFIPVNIDAENGIMYNKLNSSERINISDYKCVKIFDDKNNELEFSDIKENSVLSIAKTEDNFCLEILCSTEEVNGIIESVTDDELLLINSKEYAFDKSYYKIFSEEVYKQGSSFIGKKFYVKLDTFGNICDISVGTESDLTGGFVIKGLLLEEEYGTKLYLQLLTEEGVKRYSCSDRLIVDGKRFKEDPEKAAQAINVVNNASTDVEQGLIRYRLNSENEITEVDTLNLDESYESVQNSLTSVFEETGSERWFNYNRIDARAVLDGDTKVFFIPKNATTYDESEYFVSTYNNLLVSDLRYYIDAYYVNISNGFVDYVVCKYTYDQLPKNRITGISVIMVKDFSKKVNSDDEVVNVLTGFENGRAVEYEIPDDIDLSGVETGDLIQFTYDIRGKIASKAKAGGKTGYVMIYDCSNETPGWTENTANPNLYSAASALTNYYRAEFQLSFGYMAKVSGNVAFWGYEDDGEIDEGAIINTPIIVYDKNERGNNSVYAGSAKDLLPYESVGSDRSKIIYFTRAGAPVVMYSYK